MQVPREQKKQRSMWTAMLGVHKIRAVLLVLVLAGGLILQHTPLLHASGGTPIQFTFTLDGSYATSAGAFTLSGQLIKTLWSGVTYTPGVHTATWDGTDDAGDPVAAGNYQIRLLYDNVQYDWDGVVGNTSTAFTGDAVWHGLTDLDTNHSLAISGTTAYEAMGYNEGQAGVYGFDTATPNTPTAATVANQNVVWNLVATDGTKYYLADNGSQWDNYSSTFITAYAVSDNSAYDFPDGTDITLSTGGAQGTFTGVLEADQKSTSGGATYDGTYTAAHAATGLAVQQAGSMLAVAHGPENVVNLYDKTSGASDGSISVSDPGQVSFDANGDLWVLSGTSAYRYTSLLTTPTVAATVSGLTAPVAIAASPSDVDEVVIADGGIAQQVKDFDHTGASVWTYGTAGGYATNGPTVNTTTFQFGSQVPLAVGADGSFWIADGGTNRILHISSSQVYINQILSESDYTSSVDQTDPTRVFRNFLEFSVDYSKPLEPGDPSAAGGNGAWTLVKNWAAGLDSQYLTTQDYPGLRTVETLSNGRTYGLISDTIASVNQYPLVELTAGGLRLTGTVLTTDQSFYADGSIRYTTNSGGNLQTIYKEPLTGFDGSGNPQWGAPEEIAQYPYTVNGTDPVYSSGQWTGLGGPQFPTTSSGVTVTFNSTDYVNGGDLGIDTGMHLGGVTQGGTSFQWEASPSVTSEVPMQDTGEFDIGDSVNYAGNTVSVAGQNIVYGYQGEGWNSAEADQFMNFWDDGLFVGQFGTQGPASTPSGGVLPGNGGNELNPIIATAANGETYLYTGDESQHGGLQRWHIVGAQNVREMTADGELGSSISLLKGANTFPSGIQARAGQTNVSLAWQPVPNASGYTVKDATVAGGPYTTVATGVTGTTYTATGLTAGTPYYFVVSATVAGVESNNSDEVHAVPQAIADIQSAGSLALYHKDADNYFITSSNQYPLTIDSAASLLGDMHQNQLGSDGFTVFDYTADDTQYNHLPSGASVSLGTGWAGDSLWPTTSISIDGTTGLNDAPYTAKSGTGTLTVNPGDTAWHYLTLFMPAVFTDDRGSTITVTSQLDSSTAQYVIDDSTTGAFPHFVQFLIKGSVTISITDQGIGLETNPTNVLKAVFLDTTQTSAPISAACILASPSTLVAGRANLENISLSVLNAQGSTVASDASLTSDPAGIIDPGSSLSTALQGNESFRIKEPGFLSQVYNGATSANACDTVTQLTAGDFLNTNTVNLQDIVLGIRDYNGTAVPSVESDYDGQINISQLTGVISSYTTNPAGK